MWDKYRVGATTRAVAICCLLSRDARAIDRVQPYYTYRPRGDHGSRPRVGHVTVTRRCLHVRASYARTTVHSPQMHAEVVRAPRRRHGDRESPAGSGGVLSQISSCFFGVVGVVGRFEGVVFCIRTRSFLLGVFIAVDDQKKRPDCSSRTLFT